VRKALTKIKRQQINHQINLRKTKAITSFAQLAHALCTHHIT
jgi:hypothetical protein